MLQLTSHCLHSDENYEKFYQLFFLLLTDRCMFIVEIFDLSNPNHLWVSELNDKSISAVPDLPHLFLLISGVKFWHVWEREKKGKKPLFDFGNAPPGSPAAGHEGSTDGV